MNINYIPLLIAVQMIVVIVLEIHCYGYSNVIIDEGKKIWILCTGQEDEEVLHGLHTIRRY